MKRIILFDTSQGSLNSGDYIIKECLEKEMDFLFQNECLVKYSTHLPISRFYQNLNKNTVYKTCNKADYKFLCGTNLIKNSLFRIAPDWNINFTSCKYYQNSIAIGCGMEINAKHSDIYTKLIYKKILSKNHIHSVRDERTKHYLESLGMKVLNTGCPTLWGITPEICMAIPKSKSNAVIFTLTDYKRDPILDKELINILKNSYSRLLFWVQGFDDFIYLKSLIDINDIEIIPHALEAYKNILETQNIDYVGTRLHAGIYAIRHGIRSIIISVDNRADDMSETYRIPIVKRDVISSILKEKIESEFETFINIPTETIKIWKEQFK